ncbi:MAG: hypothetical protein V1493_04030, partial [Candidatus Diapherotrites archaeon]
MTPSKSLHCFFCLAAVLALCSMAFAAGDLSAELSASALEIQEAQAVDFNLKLADFPESLCEFEWDFGDGCSVTTSSSFISHAFFIAGRGEKEEFTVTVQVTDVRDKGKENSTVLAVASLKLSVQNSPFRPHIWQPSQFDTWEAGTEQNVSLEFEDDSALALTSAEVTSFNASIKGQKIDLNWADKDLLAGTFKPDASFGPIEKIVITAQARDLKELKKFSFPVFFESPVISVSSPFGEGSSLKVNSKIGRLEFDLKRPNGNAQDSGDFTAWLLAGATVMEKQKLSFKNSKWSGEFNYIIAEAESGPLEVTVSGQDEFGTKVEKNSFIVSVAKPGSGGQEKPETGKIEFISPMDNAIIDINAGLNMLKLQVSDQNAFDKNISAMLHIDDNSFGFPIALSCDESGVCSCDDIGLDLPLATGKHTLTVNLAQSSFSDSAEISIEIVDSAYWFKVWVLTILVFVAGFAVFIFVWRKKCKRMDALALKGRLEEIAELEKKAKVEFYKRQ